MLTVAIGAIAKGFSNDEKQSFVRFGGGLSQKMQHNRTSECKDERPWIRVHRKTMRSCKCLENAGKKGKSALLDYA